MTTDKKTNNLEVTKVTTSQSQNKCAGGCGRTIYGGYSYCTSCCSHNNTIQCVHGECCMDCGKQNP
jgi:hypothetical protein